jgi:hypothetical protein
MQEHKQKRIEIFCFIPISNKQLGSLQELTKSIWSKLLPSKDTYRSEVIVFIEQLSSITINHCPLFEEIFLRFEAIQEDKIVNLTDSKHGKGTRKFTCTS